MANALPLLLDVIGEHAGELGRKFDKLCYWQGIFPQVKDRSRASYYRGQNPKNYVRAISKVSPDTFAHISKAVKRDPYLGYLSDIASLEIIDIPFMQRGFKERFEDAIAVDFPDSGERIRSFEVGRDWLLVQLKKTAFESRAMYLEGALLFYLATSLFGYGRHLSKIGFDYISGGTFESNDRAALPGQHERLLEISNSTLMSVRFYGSEYEYRISGRSVGLKPKTEYLLGRNPSVVDECRQVGMPVGGEDGNLSVSRNHATLCCFQGGWKLEDHSTNGTTILRNGKLIGIHNDSCAVHDGDVIRPATGKDGYLLQNQV